MTPVDFASQVAEYWTKVSDNQEVARSIIEKVKHANSPALKAILRQMKDTIKPSYSVGVSDVVEAARVTGGALTQYQSKVFDITCPGCQGKWSYQQGVRDICPYCEFPYIIHVTRKLYEVENKVTYLDYFRRRVGIAEKVLSGKQGA